MNTVTCSWGVLHLFLVFELVAGMLEENILVDAVIVDAVRTPVGKPGGALRTLPPIQLGSHGLCGLGERGCRQTTMSQARDTQWRRTL